MLEFILGFIFFATPPVLLICTRSNQDPNNHGGRLEFSRKYKPRKNPGEEFFGQTLVAPSGLEVAFQGKKQIALADAFPDGVYSVHVNNGGVKLRVYYYPTVGGASRVVDSSQVPEVIRKFAVDFYRKLENGSP